MSFFLIRGAAVPPTIDDLHDEVGELRTEMNARFDSLEAKFDIIMRHITEQGNS